MSVSSRDILLFAEKRDSDRREKWQNLHRKAVSDAERIIAMIGEKYRPRRILQWGSLLAPHLFRDYSDIDIAVEGVLDPEIFFALLADAEGLTRFPLDIVQIERIEPEFRELIREKGRIVYERTD